MYGEARDYDGMQAHAKKRVYHEPNEAAWIGFT